MRCKKSNSSLLIDGRARAEKGNTTGLYEEMGYKWIMLKLMTHQTCSKHPMYCHTLPLYYPTRRVYTSNLSLKQKILALPITIGIRNVRHQFQRWLAHDEVKKSLRTRNLLGFITKEKLIKCKATTTSTHLTLHHLCPKENPLGFWVNLADRQA